MPTRRCSVAFLFALVLVLAGGPVRAQARSQTIWTATPAPVQTEKDPTTAALLSLLITGGGQIYNEEPLKGGLMLAGSVVGAVLAIDGTNEYDCDPEEHCVPALLPIGLTTVLGLKLWSLVDAPAGARKWNRNHPRSASLSPAPSVVALRNGRVGVVLLSARW